MEGFVHHVVLLAAGVSVGELESPSLDRVLRLVTSPTEQVGAVFGRDAGSIITFCGPSTFSVFNV
jgi:hypothetical protein